MRTFLPHATYRWVQHIWVYHPRLPTLLPVILDLTLHGHAAHLTPHYTTTILHAFGLDFHCTTAGDYLTTYHTTTCPRALRHTYPALAGASSPWTCRLVGHGRSFPLLPPSLPRTRRPPPRPVHHAARTARRHTYHYSHPAASATFRLPHSFILR